VLRRSELNLLSRQFRARAYYFDERGWLFRTSFRKIDKKRKRGGGRSKKKKAPPHPLIHSILFILSHFCPVSLQIPAQD